MKVEAIQVVGYKHDSQSRTNLIKGESKKALNL